MTTKDSLLLLKKGDSRVFDFIYKKYFPKLYAFIIRYTKSEIDTEDIIQEVFIKIWENKSKIDTDVSFDSYLFTITYHLMISHIRKRIREKKYLESINDSDESYKMIEFTDELQWKELQNKIQLLLNKLTPRQKEIFYLSREKNLTYEEIADRLNISVNTVRNHIVAALDFLRSNIDNEFICYWLLLTFLLE